MDTLSQSEIEAALTKRLPNCVISSRIECDKMLSITLKCAEADELTVTNIDRRRYHGEAGVRKLVREILEEIVVIRRMSQANISKRMRLTKSEGQ
ncbi:hypothetical protein [Pseudomonas simiae]|uniref:hypothetical protein n=1 Tax=Pseudomonas simiae TaxID=321846 RepID=UPI00084D3849|nr:hypothetical protein [Pseudomonas simiae]